VTSGGFDLIFREVWTLAFVRWYPKAKRLTECSFQVVRNVALPEQISKSLIGKFLSRSVVAICFGLLIVIVDQLPPKYNEVGGAMMIAGWSRRCECNVRASDRQLT
jgi:hypothetical protein